MPTYEYECEKCGNVFETFQNMSDDLLTTCTADGCNGKVKRLMGSGAGIIFKGGGFYETDYKRKSGASCPSSESKSCPNSDSCPAAKGD